MKEHRWTSRWKRFGSKECEKGRRASMPSPETSLSQYLNLFTNPEALQTPSFGVFMETLHMHNWLNHWSLVTNSICSLHPHANPHLINITKDTCVALITGHSKSFRSSVAGTRDKEQIHIYYKSQYHTCIFSIITILVKFNSTYFISISV